MNHSQYWQRSLLHLGLVGGVEQRATHSSVFLKDLQQMSLSLFFPRWVEWWL